MYVCTLFLSNLTRVLAITLLEFLKNYSLKEHLILFISSRILNRDINMMKKISATTRFCNVSIILEPI